MSKLTIAALIAAGVMLVPPAQAGDAAAGKALAEACADCHGEDGGPKPTSPRRWSSTGTGPVRTASR